MKATIECFFKAFVYYFIPCLSSFTSHNVIFFMILHFSIIVFISFLLVWHKFRMINYIYFTFPSKDTSKRTQNIISKLFKLSLYLLSFITNMRRAAQTFLSPPPPTKLAPTQAGGAEVTYPRSSTPLSTQNLLLYIFQRFHLHTLILTHTYLTLKNLFIISKLIKWRTCIYKKNNPIHIR